MAVGGQELGPSAPAYAWVTENAAGKTGFNTSGPYIQTKAMLDIIAGTHRSVLDTYESSHCPTQSSFSVR